MKQYAGIWLPDDDTHFVKALETSTVVDGRGTYQLVKIEKCLAVTERRRVALDIGAHVGLWSMILAKHFRTVEAFEPIPVLRECWKRNLEGVHNAYIHPEALGNKSSAVSMRYTPGNTGNCCVAIVPTLIQADMSPLDVLVFDSVDFIKIDVEGYEYEVLQGAKETIKCMKPVVLIEQKPGNAEYYGRGRFDASELLKSWGMSLLWDKAGDRCYGW